MKHEVAVVVLNYNGQEFLKKFLPDLVTNSHPYKVVVADNASTDSSVALLKTDFPEVRLVVLEENRGYAGGYNEALRLIEARYYILINSDVEVSENWAAPLISFLQDNQNFAACQPKILSFDDRNLLEYAGAAGGFLDFLGYPFCRGRIFDTVEPDSGQYDETIETFWASGACLAIKADLFHAVGGFDEDFFAHMEEIDLCWRLKALGFRVGCVPNSSVFHVGGGTLSKSNPKKTYLNFRNSLAVITKNLPAWELVWKLPIRLMLDILAAFVFLFNDSPGHFRAVGGAIRDFLRTFPETLAKRKLITVRERVRLSPYSVVYQYFILGKRRYRDLD